MRSEILKYLKGQTSQLPKDIDRLIVSAFVRSNNINIRNNNFIKEFIIDVNSSKKEVKNLSEFLHLIDSFHIQFDFEFLIRTFEFVISPSDKVINGAVYTPNIIREYIVEHSLLMATKDINDIKAADISCGCGGFLLSLAQKIRKQTGKKFKKIYKENLYGVDIAEYSITRTKILLILFAIMNGEDEKNFPLIYIVRMHLHFI
ncbi:N-6 DNA methylase [Niabella sp. W65]|nr:N-6 DNA methylase [Niabella sp. W65]MCH7364866.1 N-6 DNA methylase [Niabella sp. W65]